MFMQKTVTESFPFKEIRYDGHNSYISEIYIDGEENPLIGGEHESGLIKGSTSAKMKKEFFQIEPQVPISTETWPGLRSAIDDLLALWEEYKLEP